MNFENNAIWLVKKVQNQLLLDDSFRNKMLWLIVNTVEKYKNCGI